MKLLRTVLIGIVLLAMCGIMGCSGGGNTITGEVGIDKVVIDEGELTEFVIVVIFEGQKYFVDISEFITHRVAQADDGYTLDQMKTMLTVWIMDRYFPITNYSEAIRAFIYCEAKVYNNGVFLGNTGMRGAVDTIDSLTIELLFGFVDPPFSNGLCM